MQLLVAMSPGHHESHNSNYGNDSWLGLGGYTQSGSAHGNHGHSDYHGYDYATTSMPMPMEPSYPMTRPPPYAPPSHSQMPAPLVMPQQHVWPSMIATSGSYPQPILPALPLQTPVSATSAGSDMTPTSAKTTTSRRKLTDDERRLMCLEAENNPTMKQTQIGAKFNVERSTVSKILRQKDKYMKQQQPKEEVTSPGGKKPKVKLPDVERTLANWARKQQVKGQVITTEELRKQVRMFTSGRSDQQTFTTSAWLEKFRQKYLSGDTRSRTREDTADTSTTQSDTLDNSPVSSTGIASPDLSATEYSQLGHFKSERSDDFLDFDSPSLPHGFSDITGSSEVLLSPISPELSQDQFPEDTPTELNFPRQRSMTLPQLAPATSAHISVSIPAVPQLPMRTLTTVNEHKPISVDPRSTMKRHKSVPDIHDAGIVRYSTMQPPPLPHSTDISPISVSSSPVHQDETIRALHNIKRLLEQRPDVAEPDDYVMIGKLMEKLKLLRSPSGTPMLPGGMHPIDMADSPRISKKRTVVEMSM